MGSSISRSIEASSSSSVPRYSSKICQLYLVSVKPGSNTAHWGLFLNDGTKHLTGTTWEMNYTTERPNRGVLILDQTFPRSASHRNDFECGRKSFVKIKDLMKQGADATIIHDAASSFTKVEAAKERVLRNFSYKVATTNCQSFVFDMLGMLREWDPDLIDKKAIETVQRLCFPTVRLATKIRQKKIQRQDAKHSEARRPRFTSSTREFLGIDIDAPRKHYNAQGRDVQRNVILEGMLYSRLEAMPSRSSRVTMSEERVNFATTPGTWC
jgi:hypothetical protein